MSEICIYNSYIYNIACWVVINHIGTGYIRYIYYNIYVLTQISSLQRLTLFAFIYYILHDGRNIIIMHM